MYKTSTPSIKTDSSFSKHSQKKAAMQPSQDSLKNIMAFAASYRVEKIADNQFVNMIIN